jgi:hypothetical protein
MVRPGAWFLCLAVTSAASAFAQSPEASFAGPSIHLVDSPTSALPPHGAIVSRGRVFPGGGVELRLDAGLMDRVSLGIGFGGLQVIGDGDPDWDPAPGWALRARVLDETWTLPAFALGVDTRGAGTWDEERDRFQFKSRGLYVVASKNYSFLGDLSLSGGASRSFESEDDGDPTGFVGIEKSLGARAGIAVEYDLASNDNRDDGVFGRGRGYLNASLRFQPAPPVELRFVIRDMLDNSELDDPTRTDVIADEGWGREVSLSWMSKPF